MVVLLMQYGADPSIRDGEGYSCIHIAAQFAHTAVVAYLIAKGQVRKTKPQFWLFLMSSSRTITGVQRIV